ncbi:MAG: gamma-glutamylcyclotransferase family protein [Mangrovibacterium sp.]
MANPWLFSYGTLAEPEYLLALLRRLPGYTPACLPGYGLYVHPHNGYLFIKPAPGQQVCGKLFRLSWNELEFIDRWEEVPLYERETLRFKTQKGDWVEAFAYTQNGTHGLLASEAPTKSRQQVLTDIETFTEQMRRGGYPK